MAALNALHPPSLRPISEHLANNQSKKLTRSLPKNRSEDSHSRRISLTMNYCLEMIETRWDSQLLLHSKHSFYYKMMAAT